MKAPRHSGFTLIELLTVVAIIAIMATWAIPGFGRLADRAELDRQADRLWLALGTTRLEAAERRQTVFLCPSHDTSACSSNWQDSLLLFVDADKDGAFNAGDELIQRFNAAASNVSIDATGPTSNGISFKADGFTSDWGSFTLCHSERADETARKIVISSARMRRDDGGDCSGT
ncbi:MULTISPECIES: GspH/FimT family pseudopilin [Halomonas]|uniref:Type II secretion system protein H n=1 Tax=Halomonas ventosae TaxID=229007 RepID=A0A4R6HNJ2_9GAMM|nr:GspH/FimT family pseudopilin [Halomonas ventosae]TDO10530.1 type IV fimbrial biogenesis protein FimT [Halomonas ventosae]